MAASPKSSGLAELPGPYEILDLVHQNSIMLQVFSYERGWILIHPKNPSPRQVSIYMQQNDLTAAPAPGTPISNQIPAIRLYGQRLDKASPAKYWDVTALTLQADLLPRLQVAQGHPVTLTITANGVAPTKRYSVEQG
jgi:hypothetical protein